MVFVHFKQFPFIYDVFYPDFVLYYLFIITKLFFCYFLPEI